MSANKDNGNKSDSYELSLLVYNIVCLSFWQMFYDFNVKQKKIQQRLLGISPRNAQQCRLSKKSRLTSSIKRVRGDLETERNKLQFQLRVILDPRFQKCYAFAVRFPSVFNRLIRYTISKSTFCCRRENRRVTCFVQNSICAKETGQSSSNVRLER